MGNTVITWNFPQEIIKNSENIEKNVKNDEKIAKIEEKTVKYELMNVEQPIVWTIPEVKAENYYTLDLIREPFITLCITPQNAPEDTEFLNRIKGTDWKPRGLKREGEGFEDANLILNTIHSLFQKFYLPHRIRVSKDGLKIKMNDVVSFKIAIEKGIMKFYLSVPKKWERSFVSAIKQDWGSVDITVVNNTILEFNPSRTKAMEVSLRHHYGLSLTHGEKKDSFLQSISSLASTLGDNDKVLIDYNIEPVNDNWKGKASEKIKSFKKGKPPIKDEIFTVKGLLGKLADVINIAFDEFSNMIEQIMGAEKSDKTKPEPMFELRYSDSKINANSKGFKVQVRVLGESEDERVVKHAFKNIETAFSLFDGDNKFSITNVKSKKTTERIVEAVNKNEPLLGKPVDILFEKEMKNLIKLPSKETLKEYNNVIMQDTFTRTEVDEDFLQNTDGAIPFGVTLDKEPKVLHMGGYKRNDWTEKGRYTKYKQRLDDRSTATMVFGQQGSGKTSYSENQALYTFGAHIKDKEVWKKESKSVVVFDVADGEMIRNIYSRVQDWQKDRVIILNHANFKNPIAVNNADLQEFNTEIMKDDDYAYTLAEMEAKLVIEVLKSEKTNAIDRWFTTALQCAHSVDKDWGYIEAMRILTDDDFRNEEVAPRITNKRLSYELSNYNDMAMSNSNRVIIETIQNRFSQLERDAKLWDCIAQKPIRDENGKVRLNFRELMNGDEDGAYIILIHIPKSGISSLYRRFIFAHYFTKIWNVLLSREVGFGGREYRPETLIIVDEIHQIIDIPVIAKLFIDLFKEPRKYSGRYLFTLHGWSSLAKAGRGLEGDIKQSIMDNGCNLIMLRGGGEAFASLKDFLQPMTIADFNNLMNMEFCGIFAIRWKNKNHVMQAKLIPHLGSDKSEFTKYRDIDSNFLTNYNSAYGTDRDSVRDDNLERSYDMIKRSTISEFSRIDENDWEGLEGIGKK